MGKKCCVPKCKSGYASVTLGTTKISFHSFPIVDDLRIEWLRNIGRQDWEPSPNSSVCSLHFSENDFQIHSKDLKNRKKRSHSSDQIQKRILLPDAVPSIFSNFLSENSENGELLQAKLEDMIEYPEDMLETEDLNSLPPDDDPSYEEELPLARKKMKISKTKKFNVKVEDSFSNNPWCVDDASAFLKFCCPECDYQIPDLQMFSEHAVENHVKSLVLFGNETEKEQTYIKKEQVEEIEDNGEYYNDDTQAEDFSSYTQDNENEFHSTYQDYLITNPSKEEFPSIKEEDTSVVEELNFNEPLEPQVNNQSKKNHSKILTCKSCGKKLEKDETLAAHYKESKSCKNSLGKGICDICNMKCVSPATLKDHRLEHQDGKFKCCPFCDFKIEDWVRLRLHLDRKHSDQFEKNHSCDVCGKSFVFDVSCRDHKRKSHQKSDQDHVCHICGFSSKSKLHINRHILAKHEADKHKKCPHCDFHTAYIEGIHVHIDGNHSELYKKQYDCDHCSKMFIFEHSLKKHLSKLQTRKQLSCKTCNIQVSRITELDNHVLEMHPESRKNIVVKENIPSAFNLEELALDNKSKEKAICDLCFVECQCLTTLKTHKLQQHQEGKNKLCMYCDYKNVIWDNLKAHIDANHDQHGEKKHLCDLCGKGFIFQASCKRHKLHNHQKKHCHICGKETFNKASLKDHLSSVHKIDVVTSVCKICGFTTNSRASLKSHIASKHRVENHKKCPYCEYHTHSLHRIQIHIDGKHPEHDKKNFSCDHCSRRFIFENSLKNHMDTIRNGPKNWARKKMKTDRHKMMAATTSFGT